MDNNKKIYIISAILLLAILAVVLGGIFPLLLMIKNASEDTASLKQETAALQLQNNQIEDFKKKYTDYQPNLDSIGAMFIDPQNPVDFIKFLEAAASGSGIELQISLLKDSVEPLPTDSPKNFVAFEVFSHADFVGIERFTQAIEHGPYLVEIKTAMITNPSQTGASKNTNSGNVNATLQINAFVKP